MKGILNLLTVRAFVNVCLIALLVVTVGACSSNDVSYPSDLSQLHANLLDYYLASPVDDDNVGEILDNMDEDGKWPSIDYASRQRGAWPQINHLENLKMMALAYRTPDSRYYHKSSLSKQIHLSLNYWLHHDCLSPNWWYQHIGVPEALAPTLFMMEDELTEDQMQKALVLMRRAGIRMSGQNKVWLSGNVLFRALLVRDADTLALASASIQEELVTGKGEGIQTDWSYHQHGAQLQFGNYGLSYLEDMLRWYQILDETPFAFSSDKAAIMRHYALEGLRWVDWKNHLDVSACGRQIFPNEPHRKSQRLHTTLTTLSLVDDEYASQYLDALDYATLSGNRHFWHSDFQVQRTKDYYFSVKMCSDRVLGAETVNKENIQGYHMGDGVTFLYQTGKEYDDVLPFWNWRKLPGTTLIQKKDTLPWLTAWGYHIESDFVGGVSDSLNGIAVLDYQRDGLQAHKSWFMFDDKIVCLGSGISAQTDYPVTTNINQVLLGDEFLIHANHKTQSYKKRNGTHTIDWLLHDGVGYVFPNSSAVTLSARVREGSWSRVAKRYRPVILIDDVFNMWIDHGKSPREASYEYVIVPNADKASMTQYHDEQPFLIKNTKALQQVSTTDGSMAGVVFYKAGTSSLYGGVQVDNACLLMIKKQGAQLKISIADPTQKLKSIKLKINNKDMTIPLPQGAKAGKTVSVLLDVF